jgi:biotin carboxyl carrier protein
MKYIVKVADKSFEVDIQDIHARPIIARVDGQEFEVSLGNEVKQVSPREPQELKTPAVLKQPSNTSIGTNELTAPLPGTVIEIFVKAGDTIEAGQVVLVIEAMKMKNSIRSTRAGKVAQVLISAGQTVAHKQPLVKFEDG